MRLTICVILFVFAVFLGFLGFVTKSAPTLVVCGALTLGLIIMAWPNKR